MDVRSFVGVLSRRWRTALALTLLGVGASVVVTGALRPTYEATVQTFISLRQSEKAENPYQDNLFSQARVKSYAELVSSTQVTSAVVDSLRLAMTPRQLAEQISASAPPDTVLVNITVRDTSRTRARDIANAVGKQFAHVVDRIETPAGERRSPVRVTVVRPAELPGAPVSPRSLLNLTLGLVLGATTGVAVAMLRDLLDSTVKSQADVAALTGSSPLGTIGFDRHTRRHPLVEESEPRAARGEAFRTLRTNLRFVDVGTPPRVLAVTSSGIGEGKSTTACNLAVTMARAGIEVILVDADLRRPSVADYMGLEGAAGLTDVLVGRCGLDDVLQPWAGLPIRVLTSGTLPPNPSELLGSPQMTGLLADLRTRAEFVLLDTPPLLPVTDAALLAPQCDGAIVVVRYGHTNRAQLGRALDALRRVNARVLGTVLTMARSKADPDYGRYTRAYREPSRRRRSRPGGRHTPVGPAGAAGEMTRTDAVHTDSQHSHIG